jgi:hypothetical protein
MSNRITLAPQIADGELEGFLAALVAEFGISPRTAQRWVREGVNWATADRVAVKILGRHPQSVWGQSWTDLADDAAGLGDFAQDIVDDARSEVLA